MLKYEYVIGKVWGAYLMTEQHFGTRMRRRRLQLGMKQQALADRLLPLVVYQSGISDLEKSGFPPKDEELQEALAAALQWSLPQLLGVEEPEDARLVRIGTLFYALKMRQPDQFLEQLTLASEGDQKIIERLVSLMTQEKVINRRKFMPVNEHEGTHVLGVTVEKVPLDHQVKERLEG